MRGDNGWYEQTVANWKLGQCLKIACVVISILAVAAVVTEMIICLRRF